MLAHGQFIPEKWEVLFYQVSKAICWDQNYVNQEKKIKEKKKPQKSLTRSHLIHLPYGQTLREICLKTV